VQFAREKVGYLRQMKGVGNFAIEATKFMAARLYQHKALGLMALNARWRRRVFGHVTLALDQAGALPNSQSPPSGDEE
jgi:hypothetical protein